MIQRSIHTLLRAVFILGGLLFLTMVFLTIANIALRVGGESLRGTVELSGYLGAAAMGLCLPWVQYTRAHAEVGVRFARLSPLVQKLQQVLVSALCLAMSLAFTLELYDLTLFVHEGMETVDGFDIASAIFVAALTLGCAGQGLVLALQVITFMQKSCASLSFLSLKSLRTPTAAVEGR